MLNTTPLRALAVLSILLPVSFGQIASQYTVKTIAGTFPLGDGGQATAALLETPQAVAVDSKGVIYIADSGNFAIRKVTTDGVISTFPWTNGYIYDLKVDAAGNLYASTDTQVYRVSPAGATTLLAGSGGFGYSGDGGSAKLARFSLISGFAIDSAGNLFIADFYNHRVRKVGTDGNVSTVAGNGQPGTLDGTTATVANLWYPESVAVDSLGNLYIADTGNYKVRKVSTNGIMTTVAGNGYCCGSDSSGNALNFSMYPTYVMLDSNNNIYTSDGSRVRVIDNNGKIRTLLGSARPGNSGDGGLATQAQIASPYGIAFDSQNNLYMADATNDNIRKVAVQSGIVTTVAGGPHYAGDGGPATSAVLHRPQFAKVGSDGTIYFSDGVNNRVRKISPSGTISTIAGNGRYDDYQVSGTALSLSLYPERLALDGAGNLYIVDQSEWILRKMTPDGNIVTAAGNGYAGSASENAPASRSPNQQLVGVAAAPDGTLYVSDYGNHKIRKINTDGAMTTYAGSGTKGFSGDGALATTAWLNSPTVVAIDKTGNVYFYDSGTYHIRKITPAGIISTVAGSGQCCNNGDGAKATSAAIYVTDMDVDAAGNIWFVSGSSVRVVDTTGIIRTVAGAYSYSGLDGDNLPASADTRFRSPGGIAVAANGDIIVVDTRNSRIRRLVAQNPTRLDLVSGNNQTGTVGAPFAQQLTVKVQSSSGPMAGVTVAFAVTAGQGRLSSTAALSDANGQASVTLTPLAAGSLTVTATVGTFTQQFTFTAVVDTPAKLDIVSGGNQTGTVGTAFAQPLVVKVQGSNGALSGVSVAFAVTSGQGRLSASTMTTDQTGQTSVTLTPLAAGSLAVTASVGSLSQVFSGCATQK